MSNRFHPTPRAPITRGFRPQCESLEPRRLLTAMPSEYPLAAEGGVRSLVEAPDGEIWFIPGTGDQLCRFDPATGAVSDVSLAQFAPGQTPWLITAAADGSLWFTLSGNEVGRFDPGTNTLTGYQTPASNGSPGAISIAPDGNVWFAQIASLGEINPATGVVKEYPIPVSVYSPYGVVAVSGGVWFIGAGADVDQLDPATGVITVHSTSPDLDSRAEALAATSSGYVTDILFDPAGPNSSYAIGGVGGFGPSYYPDTVFYDLTIAPNGMTWWYTGGDVNPETQDFTDPTPTVSGFSPTLGWPGQIVSGPDGNAWFAETGGLGEIVTNDGKTATSVGLSVSPSVVVFGQAATVTAVVSSGTTEVPSGTVSLRVNGQVQPPVPLMTVDGQQQVSLSLTGLVPGNSTITATYNGDGTFASATSTTFNVVGLTNASAAPPSLATQSLAGSNASGPITENDGSAKGPLTLQLSGPDAQTDLYYRLYDVTDPSNPVLLTGPVQLTAGYDQITDAGQALTNGIHQLAYTTAASPTGAQGPLSQALTLTVQVNPLRVLSISRSANFATSLPNGQVVVTFSDDIAGLFRDGSHYSGFVTNPFAVTLIPSGPDGGAQAARGEPLWTAPSGADGGDLPIPANLRYQQNADGTSTITLIPDEALSTDIYLITISSALTSVSGAPLIDAQGNTGPEYSSFDYHASPVDTTPLAVTGVTADDGIVVINNDRIPQPDTIAITFNKPLDTWTVNSSSVQLIAKSPTGGTSAVTAVVAYNPTGHTVYLTPEVALEPGTIYYLEVNTTVSDDQAFPATAGTLARSFYTSFTVDAPVASAGSSPLALTALIPRNPDGDGWSDPLGYVTVTFSEPIRLSSLERYSVMLVTRTGGVTTGNTEYADVPLNAKLAFNPNTNQLIIVPTTGILPDEMTYLVAVSGISATNGDSLGGTPIDETFHTGAPFFVLVLDSIRIPSATPTNVISASTTAVPAVSSPSRIAVPSLVKAHAATIPAHRVRPLQSSDDPVHDRRSLIGPRRLRQSFP